MQSLQEELPRDQEVKLLCKQQDQHPATAQMWAQHKEGENKGEAKGFFCIMEWFGLEGKGLLKVTQFMSRESFKYIRLKSCLFPGMDPTPSGKSVPMSQ